jgi:transcriptional regulator with XRE-family HTH domain
VSRKKFADLIIQAREAKKLSQVRVAAEMDVSSQQVSRWERASSLPTAKLLPRLAEILGIEPGVLYEAYALASQEETQDARREISQTRRDLENALEQVKIFVDTYQSFHAAYQKIGEQVDQLVADQADLKTAIVEIKRAVLGHRSGGPPG